MPSKNPDAEYIRTMFDRLARRYDLFNQLISMGLARFWRKETLRPVKPGMKVLDLGCGTGDLVLEAAKEIGSGEIVGLDFSPQMLEIAKKRWGRVQETRASLVPYLKVRFVLKKAEELPIEKESYDMVVSGFVLRNLYQNIDQILLGVHQSLKNGGMISFVDITEPENRLWAMIWKIYFNTIAVFYGKMLFGKDYPSLYLAQSAERFVKAQDFVKKLEAAGFKQTRARALMLGVITLYQAVK